MKTGLPVPRALFKLVDIVLEEQIIEAQALNFALTWLAAARMVVTSAVPGLSQIVSLADEAGWAAVAQAGLPIGNVHRWMLQDKQSGVAIHSKALSVVSELVADMGPQPWDVMPWLSALTQRSRELDLNKAAVELLLESVGNSEGELWIPFDASGALAIQALRKGWNVNAAQMMGVAAESSLPLLLAIEFGGVSSPRLSTEVTRDGSGRPLTTAQYVLACPPIGAPLRDSKLLQWASDPTMRLERNARSEPWIVREVLQRAGQKAVFLLPPSMLFSGGQEGRLREFLLNRAGPINELESVVTLPSGVMNTSPSPTAVVVVTPGTHHESILLVDISESRKGLTNLQEHIGQFMDVALGRRDDPQHARRIRRTEISKTDFCLAPSRYLRDPVSLGSNTLALDDLCALVRPPVVVKEESGVEVFELGIPELVGWAPVGALLEKRVLVRERATFDALEPGDVILSIKGTVGRAGLVDPNSIGKRVIPSQSCIGLRLKGNSNPLVTPRYLLMFLRSATGQAQLQSLQTGASAQQVNPTTLLRDFQVPIPDKALLAEVEAEYEQLCRLESEVLALQGEIAATAAARWPVNSG